MASSTTIEIDRDAVDWTIDRKLAGTLVTLVDRVDLTGAALEHAVAELAADRGDPVYAELIFQLSRVRLSGPAAKREWSRILEHRDELARRTASPVDLRVGLLSHFLDHGALLEQPTVVEMEWVRRTVASVHVDELTGLPNYRALRAALSREAARAGVGSAPLSLIVLDIDDFKAINDEHGHASGNEVLASIGRSLEDSVRGSDLAARYGGEEFVVLLPGTAKRDAEHVAERIRATIESRTVRLDGDTRVSPTASLGVATIPGDATDGQILLQRADEALYEAKRGGKNVVRAYGRSSRSFSRRDARWSGRIRTVHGDEFDVTTLVIGEGGMLVRATRSPALDALVELRLDGPRGEPLEFAARVVRVEPADADGYGIALRLIEQGAPDRVALREWVRSGD